MNERWRSSEKAPLVEMITTRSLPRFRRPHLRKPEVDTRHAVVMLAVAVVGAVVLAMVFNDGPPEVDPSALPTLPGTTATHAYVNCSPTGATGYIPNRPCDTYFLITPRSGRFRSAASLLISQQALLRRAAWRHVPVSSTWGYEFADGWIGPVRSAYATT